MRIGTKGSIFPAHMVRGPLPPRLEDHVRGHEKFSLRGDASHRAAGDGLPGLHVPQYPRVQSKAAGRSAREGRSAGGVNGSVLLGRFSVPLSVFLFVAIRVPSRE